MNYFELYPGDYLRDTTRLTLVEHGAFLRLLMAYYAEEEPLPAELVELYVIAGALSSADKSAVKKVADRFFPVGPDGLRHNKRADEEIAKAAERMEGADERKANDADRKRRSRERRAAMFSALRAVGVVPDFDITMADLSDLVAANVTRDQCVTLGVTPRDKSRPVTRDGTATRPQTPDPSKNHGISESAQGEPIARSPAADHAIALNRLGVRVTAHDPRLIDAVAEGVTTQQLTDLAEAHPGKGAPYLIATARGQLRDGANAPAGTANGTHQPRESLVDRNARRAAEILGRTGTE